MSAPTGKESYNPHFWHDGLAGPANIVTYNGEDIRGVSYVADDRARRLIIEKHNKIVRELMAECERMARQPQLEIFTPAP
ncbi:hypothetical protein LUCX_156 [Xanthomonas phage vB_XciM_LucasX]|nr:hypothetical protein LUCX_156 [Xanthomonas phage vB_XciM_LucasX]